MTIATIRKLQKQYGYDNWQKLIESGQVWSLEGSAGRGAMDLLENGVCFLPKEAHKDYYGNTVPSRNHLEDGTKGTLGNAIAFWTRVEDGEVNLGKDEYFDWM